MLTLGVFGVAFVMFAALAVHAAGGFENVLGVEAWSTECSGIIIHSAACGTGNGLLRVR